jgi:bifunctional non-homologous end joining protein LigD
MLWDRGFWAADGDAAKALRKGELRFTLVGEKLQGSWVLVRLRHDREHGKRTNWLLIKRHDGYEREDDGEAILGQDRSVASGRGMTSLPARAEARSPSCWTRRTASKRTRSGIRTGTRAKGHAHLPYLRARR